MQQRGHKTDLLTDMETTLLASRSCFYWAYRASSQAAIPLINLFGSQGPRLIFVNIQTMKSKVSILKESV